MTLKKHLENCTVSIRKETFDIVKARRPMPGAFAVVASTDEITIVIEESRVIEENVVEIEKGWKLLTFETVLPFDLVGFLATVSNKLAQAGVSIFAISSYSTDHILVKEADLPDAVDALKALGCNVILQAHKPCDCPSRLR